MTTDTRQPKVGEVWRTNNRTTVNVLKAYSDASKFFVREVSTGEGYWCVRRHLTEAVMENGTAA